MGIRGQFVERLEYTSSRVVHLFQTGAKTTSHPWRKISRVGNENAVKKREESRERFSRLVLFPSHVWRVFRFHEKISGKTDRMTAWRKRERNRKKKVVFEKYKSRTMQLPRGAAFLRGAQFFEIPVDKSPTGDPLSRLSIKTFPPNLSTLSFYFFSLHHLERERWNPFESPCLSETDLDSSSPRISSSPRLK